MTVWQFRRRLLIAELLLVFAELVAVVWPLGWFFTLPAAAELPVLLGALCGWVAIMMVWSIALRRRAAPIERALKEGAQHATAGYRALLHLPWWALVFRTLLWFLLSLALATLLWGWAHISKEQFVAVVSITTIMAVAVGLFRTLAYDRLFLQTLLSLAPSDPLERFFDSYKWRLLLAALLTGTFGICAIAAYIGVFVPINSEHYFALITYFPLTALALTLAWIGYLAFVTRPIDRYLEQLRGSNQGAAESLLRPAHRAAVLIPYQLALAKVLFWWVAEILLFVESTTFFDIDSENASLMSWVAAGLTLGVAVYEMIWHRLTMRPLLVAMASRHPALPKRLWSFSVRGRMLLGFGALTAILCLLSVGWSFMQYKAQATMFIQHESRLRLDVALDKVRRAVVERGDLSPAQVESVLRTIAGDTGQVVSAYDATVFYYLPPGPSASVVAIGSGTVEPPGLPGFGEALLRRLPEGWIELSNLRLTGCYERLYIGSRDLGSIAVLLNGYRSRSPSMAPHIRVLIYFFAGLLFASLGLVIMVATDLSRPIRELERRAGQMAGGNLSEPVMAVAGEGAEIEGLTLAFEEMRRALSEKFQTSAEMNRFLETEVSRRSVELQRAQSELMRSEKLASMGRLVAGIAHEINNPVNALVNTVGPLEERLSKIVPPTSIDSQEIRAMLGVMERGAYRTKQIVSALHNYSRSDESRQVDIDLRRGIDDSLDLLRHHLKNGIVVERDYRGSGKVRGTHALHQVFMNLLTNAAQAVASRPEGGGVIRISTRETDGQITVEVADNGPGIASDVLPHIFDPFFTTKEVGEGSGLGLSIVHGIVERHGGTIRVDSTLGQGTRFRVVLPVAHR